MATDKVESKYRRATEFTKGLGENLDKIEGVDVLLWDFTIQEGRQIKGNDTSLVTMTITTLNDEANKQLFHAWSEPLATRLNELSNSEAEMPVLIQFVRAATLGGFKVWTIK